MNKLEELKKECDELRQKYCGKRSVQWPKDFKQKAIDLIESESETVKSTSEALNISQPTLSKWKKDFLKKEPRNDVFKSIDVVGGNSTTKNVELNWHSGLIIKGLSFLELKELLKERLI